MKNSKINILHSELFHSTFRWERESGVECVCVCVCASCGVSTFRRFHGVLVIIVLSFLVLCLVYFSHIHFTWLRLRQRQRLQYYGLIIVLYLKSVFRMVETTPKKIKGKNCAFSRAHCTELRPHKATFFCFWFFFSLLHPTILIHNVVQIGVV